MKDVNPKVITNKRHLEAESGKRAKRIWNIKGSGDVGQDEVGVQG